MKKRCSICEEEKELTEFYKAARMKDGRQSCCKKCANVQNVTSMNKKPNKYKAHRQLAEKIAVERFWNWKQSIGCQVCDEREPVCLELHHKDPSEKEIQPNKLRKHKWETFMAEAKKCILLCSNCHKKVHAGILDDSSIPTIGDAL